MPRPSRAPLCMSTAALISDAGKAIHDSAQITASPWPSEQPAVNCLPQNMTLNGFQHVDPRLEGIGRRLYVQLGIQGVKFKHIVMQRTVRRGPWTPIHGSRGTHLIAAVR